MSTPPPRSRRLLPTWINVNLLGVALLLGTVGTSLYRVTSIHRTLFDPSVTTIRIAHWQLETGYRNAMDVVIAEYEKLHPNVRVIQMPVTEKVYAQWLNTHLISGDAPELAEMGMSSLINNDQYVIRYFLPMTELIDQPNPYDRGTPLEKIPWRETFVDGMRGSYKERLQDYYGIPTTFTNMRLFYNKDMVRRVTGSDKPPRTFGQLLDLCKAIRAYGQQRGEKLTPIAGSGYSVGIFVGKYVIPFTAAMEPELDADLDGLISDNETYAGFMQGKFNFQTPRVRAYYECFKTLCDQFSEGFMAVDRQSAAFSFVQSKSAIIATGSWDAESLFQQADFEVGVFDFPLPASSEPWGQYISGRASEATVAGGGLFGVYKNSRNQKQAIDFLHFITSPKYNELFNQACNWIPIVLGAKPSDRMMPFAADPIGYTSQLHFDFGVDVTRISNGYQSSFYQGQMTYEQFSKSMEELMRDDNHGGDRAWVLQYDELTRQCRSQDRVLAIQAARELMDPKAVDAPAKYAQVLLQQMRFNNGENLRHRFVQVRGKPLPEK